MAKAKRFSVQSFVRILDRLYRGDPVDEVAQDHQTPVATLAPLHDWVSSVRSHGAKKPFFAQWTFWRTVGGTFLVSVVMIPYSQSIIYPLLPGPVVTASWRTLDLVNPIARCHFYELQVLGQEDAPTSVNILLSLPGRLGSHAFENAQPRFFETGGAIGKAGIGFARDNKRKLCLITHASDKLDPEFREIDKADNIRITATDPQPDFGLVGAFVVNAIGSNLSGQPSLVGSIYKYEKLGFVVTKPILLVPWRGSVQPRFDGTQKGSFKTEVKGGVNPIPQPGTNPSPTAKP